jgi:hypothetical protein
MDCAMFVSRAHAQQLAFQRWGGLAGLEAEKAKRRVKAEARHKEALKEYKKKKAAALKAGTKVSSFPKESSLLTNEIDLRDGGWATTEDTMRLFVLVFVGFSQKDAPLKALSSDVDDPGTYIECRYCLQANPTFPFYKKVVFPDYYDLAMGHLGECEHNTEIW